MTRLPCPHPDCSAEIPVGDLGLPDGVYRCLCHACSLRLRWVRQPDPPWRRPTLELAESVANRTGTGRAGWPEGKP